jgi:hypothetical protein
MVVERQILSGPRLGLDRDEKKRQMEADVPTLCFRLRPTIVNCEIEGVNERNQIS